MTHNPFADDPTIQAEFFNGRWINKGKTFTTQDVFRTQTGLTRAVERINDQRSLSREAKQIAIAKAYRDARNQIQAAGQTVIDQATTERARLSRKLFGYEGDADPQTVAIRRDAADRAARIDTPEAAARALKTAEMNGDQYLAQAIAGQANANMWNDVVTTYLEARPDAGQAATQLRALPDTTDPVWRMQHAMTYSVMQPSELGGMPDYQVDRLADTVLDDGTTTSSAA